MDQARIEQLLRMAHEIETLEAEAAMRPDFTSVAKPAMFTDDEIVDIDAAAASLSFAREVERRRLLQKASASEAAKGRRWRATVAGAAVLLLGAIAFRQVSPLSGTPRAWTSPLASARGGATSAAADVIGGAAAAASELSCASALPTFGSRIIAMALDSDSECSCSQTVLHRWDSPDAIDSVSRAELLRIGLESSCVTEPQRILVVVVSGPVEDLPASDEAIAALARCVDQTAQDDGVGYLGQDEADYAASAISCLGGGLTVHTVSMLNR
jgi:hypothetical protein